MTTPADPSQGPGTELGARLEADLATLDRELAEIELLIGQARIEAARHEQKRAAAADRLPPAGKGTDATVPADAAAQLVTLTRRAVLMESQVDLLESKLKALARHRAAVADIARSLQEPPEPDGSAGPTVGESQMDSASLPPGISRVVLGAQEDLRREIARAMHDGPAQSLTNIVLQAQIVERLLERDPGRALGELRSLVAMVQHTLDATKSFIFDVRPMVLDDLGLMPTLRRAARDRGRRAHVAVEFESLGQDERMPVEVETTVFRILDEALAGYLSLGPEHVSLRMDWSDGFEAVLSASRAPGLPSSEEPLPGVPSGKDVPDAIKQMIQDRHDAREAAAEAAAEAAIVSLPSAVRKVVAERAATIGAAVELLAGGSRMRLVVPVLADERPRPE